MKNEKDIIARAVILLCISDRCALEKSTICGRTYSKSQRENQRVLIYNWLKNKGYVVYMTEVEIQLFEKEIGIGNKDEILSIQFQYEAIEPCLWYLGLIRELSSYDQFVLTDFHPVLCVGPHHDIGKILESCKLRESQELLLKNEIAMLWHWRTKEWGNPIFRTRKTKDIVYSIFGCKYDAVLENIQQLSKNQEDFLINGIYFKELLEKEILQIGSIAKWRHHAFEWIVGNDPWDKVELDT